jgi:hypothetical protein
MPKLLPAYMVKLCTQDCVDKEARSEKLEKAENEARKTT